ncbi:hypothetical protein ACIPF8_18865 [Collimonas sp. NPDC087041]|uniref:hypothetical protein n=1 Tax=Collimonas sp. NPDC087041 TaxID=3363960 RepID=UPI0037FF53C6
MIRLQINNLSNRQSKFMRLYHYTAAALADYILISNLSVGHMSTPQGPIRPVVWLTTDPNPEGHGLLTGAEVMTESNRNHVEKMQGQKIKNNKTQDKTKVRLTFDIPDKEMYLLQPFTDYCARFANKQFAKWTGVSCYIDAANTDTKRVIELMKTLPTKEKTWWISFMPISASFITAVEFRGNDGAYYPVDFEKNARRAFEDLGFFSPSSEALSELLMIVKPHHPLGYTKALVFCHGPDETPTATISGGATHLEYEIETGRSLTDTTPYEPHLSAWVTKHRTELMVAWEQAKESYYSFYPTHRP